LLSKSGPDFWKIWKSKSESKSTNIIQVEGTVDNELIADEFAKHFESLCTPISAVRNDELKSACNERRLNYYGSPLLDGHLVDVELISSLMVKMDNGKAAGLDELSSEQ
jgi:hypothetical protein